MVDLPVAISMRLAYLTPSVVDLPEGIATSNSRLPQLMAGAPTESIISSMA